MRYTYVATVQLVIEAENESKAMDAINNILSDYDMGYATLKDWNYLRVGNQRLTPTRDYGELPDYLEAFHAGLGRSGQPHPYP